MCAAAFSAVAVPLATASISLPIRVATCCQVLTCGNALVFLSWVRKAASSGWFLIVGSSQAGITAGSELYALNCATWVLGCAMYRTSFQEASALPAPASTPQVPPAEKETLPADPAGSGAVATWDSVQPSFFAAVSSWPTTHGPV